MSGHMASHARAICFVLPGKSGATRSRVLLSLSLWLIPCLQTPRDKHRHTYLLLNHCLKRLISSHCIFRTSLAPRALVADVWLNSDLPSPAAGIIISYCGGTVKSITIQQGWVMNLEYSNDHVFTEKCSWAFSSSAVLPAVSGCSIENLFNCFK